MTGVTHPIAQHNGLLLKTGQAHGCVDTSSISDIAGTIRKTLDVDGACPAIVVGDNTHWRVMLIDARSQKWK